LSPTQQLTTNNNNNTTTAAATQQQHQQHVSNAFASSPTTQHTNHPNMLVLPHHLQLTYSSQSGGSLSHRHMALANRWESLPSKSSIPQGVRWWLDFCLDEQLIPLRVNTNMELKSARQMMEEELDIMLFCQWLEDNRSVLGSTTTSYVSQLKIWHKNNSLQTLGMPGKSALAELTRQLRMADPPRDPERVGVSKAMLQSAKHMFSMHLLEDLTHWTLMQAGMELLARGCELGRSTEDKEALLTIADVHPHLDSIKPHIIVMIVPAKKKGRKEKIPMPLDYIEGDENSAAWCIMQLLKMRGEMQLCTSSQDPLFIKPLTKSAFTTDEIKELVQFVASVAKENPSTFGAHSLRIGGATAIFENGGTKEELQAAGRWDSDLGKLHIRVNKLRLRHLNTAAFHVHKQQTT
jgi:hypothetical protein